MIIISRSQDVFDDITEYLSSNVSESWPGSWLNHSFSNIIGPPYERELDLTKNSWDVVAIGNRIEIKTNPSDHEMWLLLKFGGGNIL